MSWCFIGLVVVPVMKNESSDDYPDRVYFDTLLWRVAVIEKSQAPLVIALLKPFKEGSVFGVEVETTDLFQDNPGVYEDVVCRGFHECVGNFLKQTDMNEYTGKLIIVPFQPQDYQVALTVVSYSEDRIMALQEAFGDTIFLTGHEHIGKVKINETDRSVGLYMMARMNYLEESQETDTQIFEVLPKA